jgi:DNA-binding NtrC family response regulator
VTAITRTRFDAVVTDLTMTGDGQHVLERLQTLQPGTPVIVVTGDPTKSRCKSIVGGAYAILNKPFSTARLVSLLRQARARRPRRGRRPS